MADTGKKITLGIAAYLILKTCVNIVIGGFGLENVLTLCIEFGMASLLFFRVPKSNFIVGAFSVLMALYYLPGNLRGLPQTWFYLVEAALDVAAAVTLFVSKSVRGYIDDDIPH